jgi:hypothetical protein
MKKISLKKVNFSRKIEKEDRKCMGFIRENNKKFKIKTYKNKQDLYCI